MKTGYSNLSGDTDDPSPEGPTIEEFVRAGYKAEHYPPQGFAERLTDGLVAYRAYQVHPHNAALHAAAAAALGVSVGELTHGRLARAAHVDVVGESESQQAANRLPDPLTLTCGVAVPVAGMVDQPCCLAPGHEGGHVANAAVPDQSATTVEARQRAANAHAANDRRDEAGVTGAATGDPNDRGARTDQGDRTNPGDVNDPNDPNKQRDRQDPNDLQSPAATTETDEERQIMRDLEREAVANAVAKRDPDPSIG